MLIGAHYYAWYKKRSWPLKTARYYLGQSPQNTWYENVLKYAQQNNGSEETVAQHFKLCKEYGIDFLLISQKNEDLLPYLDLAEQFGIKIAAHCETLEKIGQKIRVEKENLPRLLFDLQRIKDWMLHPAWLRIDNKPVIAYYVTRQIADSCVNDFASQVREICEDCFLLADEVWWGKPKPHRLLLFDGIFGYNMYINNGQKMDKGKVFNKGFTGHRYLEMLSPYEEEFFRVSLSTNTKYFPTVLPGYNDRAVRYDQDHYIIPREQGAFFQQYLEHSKKFLRDEVLLVTSFNEWYEDSQIEPVIQSQKNIPFDKRDLFQNVPHENYGLKYLEILKSFKDNYLNKQVPVVIEPESVKHSNREQLLDHCALLYYQTTISSILVADNTKKKNIKKEYYESTEEALRKGITVQEIKKRAIHLSSHFSSIGERAGKDLLD